MVGGWFLMQQGLVQVSATVPSWLIGPVGCWAGWGWAAVSGQAEVVVRPGSVHPSL